MGPEAGPKGQIYRLVTQEKDDYHGTRGLGSMGQIWACDRGKRWLPWDQRLVPKDKYGLVIEVTGDFMGHIWAFDRGNRLLPWDQRLVSRDKYIG
jgi:hypothetical protein